MILNKSNKTNTSVSIATLLSIALAITMIVPGPATAASVQVQTSKTAQANNSGVIDQIATSINKLFPTQTSTVPQIPESDLASLTQPGVVRIVQHSVGKIFLKSDFVIDWKTLTIKPVPLSHPLSIPVDDYALGSGFIITPDGYIVTNSHVVSKQEMVESAMEKLQPQIVNDSLDSLSAAEQKKLVQDTNSLDGTAALQKVGADLLKDLVSYSSSTIDVTVTVLDPTSTDTTLSDLIKDGFPATVKSVNDNFTNDERDVAIIKIDQTNLPALQIASDTSSSSIMVGQPIHIFGFPATADFTSTLGQAGFLTPTFTSGSITAFKDSDDASFKVLETDAKTSSGSSGSPVLNSQGQVIGIMTYGSAADSSDDTNGDGFSFAIPLDVIWPVLNQAGVTPQTGNLYSHFMSGYDLSAGSRCNEAISQFSQATTVNTHFHASDFIAPYVQRCQAVVASGKSIDSDLDLLKINLESVEIPLIIGGGGFALFIIMLIAFLFLMRKLRRDEKIIARMEKEPVYKMSMDVPPRTTGPSISPNASNSTAASRLYGQPTPMPARPAPQPQQVQAPAQALQTRVAIPQSAPAQQMNQPITESNNQQAGQPITPSTNQAAPTREKVESIMNYIVQQRNAGVSGGPIVLELRKAGCTDAEIQQAFLLLNASSRQI